MAKREKQKLNYRFHNPNPDEVFIPFLINICIEANQYKVEKAIREAAEEEIISKPQNEDNN